MHRSSTGVARLAGIVGLAVCLAACGLRAGSSEFAEVFGVATACAADATGVAIDARVDGTVRHFEISEDDLPWPAREYASLIKNEYVVSGGCPAQGQQLRILECRRCSRPTTAAIELGGRGSSFDEAQRSLWIYRQFLNYEARGRDERTHEFLLSSVLARYNRADKKERALWIRDRLSHVLSAYSSEDRAEAMMRRFGPPGLELNFGPIGAIYREWGNRRGLVRGLPYLPSDPRSSPFIGAWGVFPVEIHVEQAGALTRLYGAQ